MDKHLGSSELELIHAFISRDKSIIKGFVFYILLSEKLATNSKIASVFTSRAKHSRSSRLPTVVGVRKKTKIMVSGARWR